MKEFKMIENCEDVTLRQWNSALEYSQKTGVRMPHIVEYLDGGVIEGISKNDWDWEFGVKECAIDEVLVYTEFKNPHWPEETTWGYIPKRIAILIKK